MEMSHYDKDNIYQNNIAILSLSHLDEDNGRTTAQFSRPSHQINGKHTSSTAPKRWYRFGLYKFVATSLAVICVCVVLGVVITTYKNARSHTKGELSPLSTHSDSPAGTEPITLNDVMLGSLAPLRFNGTWINSGEIVYYDGDNNLCTFDVIAKQKQILISSTQVITHGLSGDLLSKNKQYLLITYDTKKTFRHSTLSKYKIYNIAKETSTDLLSEDSGNGLIQFAEWGPKGTDIVLVYKNNIYYKPDIDQKPIQLTDSGATNFIYNGYSDWVYEEEILEDEKAFWVSPEGSDLVYAQINDTLVDTMTWPYYGQYYNFTGNQYPTQVALKYPKPGRQNPTVRLFVMNLNESVENIGIRELTPPNMISKHQYYLTAVGWIDNNRFSITWLTRAQNFSVIEVCERNSLDTSIKSNWICKTTFTMGSANSWVELYKPPIGAPEHNAYLIKLPQLINKELGYYYHVAMVNITSKHVKYLTMGSFDIIEIVAFNQHNQEVYFLSTLTEKPEFRHLMSVSINDEKKVDPICLTCNLGDSCLYNNVHFSPDAEYYVLQCEGPKTPRVEVRDTKNNSLIADLENNESLERKLSKKAIPRTQKLRIKTSSDFYANVELVLPPDFDRNSKYPVLVEVYGGPGSQMVIDKYRLNHWGSHLASNLSIIYARIDGRGSDNRGSKYLHEIYKNFGNVEVMDIIVATRYIRDNLSFVDKKNIGIWGWSYGGYVTLMALALDFLDPVFQCGIAVSPVTNWMLYDSVYVERYMGWPADNMLAYNRSDVLNKVLFLKEKRLLLVFGTADDNVHSQHSMLLISKLNEIGMFYETQIYPDSGHSLSEATVHLYDRMEEFVERSFFF